MSTLTEKEISLRVIKVVTDELKLNCPFDLTNKLREDLGADDMSIVEISMALDEEFDEFNIEVSGDDNIKFNTVADIVDCIKKKLGVE